MSGAVAAHAAYNGSGTQGLAVTNKIQDQEGDVMSVFWNKNDTTRQLLHGAAFIDIPTSGNGGTTSFGGNQIFTINNDIDAIGDMYLHVSAAGDFHLKGSLASIIKRVEFHVGTQIWHTLEKEDIQAINMTEMPEGVFGAYHRSTYGSYDKSGAKNKSAWGIKTQLSNGASGVIKIPTISRQVGPTMSKYTNVVENAYLVAAAPHQTVKVKVYLENQDYVKKNVFSGAPDPYSATVAEVTAMPTLELKLFGKHIIMCNEEREQMKSMPQGLPKRIKMSQNVTHAVGSHSTEAFTVDLDHFSLYASHLLITVIGGSGSAKNNDRSTSNSVTLNDVELKLNSSSYSGTLRGSLLTASATDMLGLYQNTQAYYDGSDENPTGLYRTYVFPLASQAFSGSSVPLNRFDNIRLTMTLSTDQYANATGTDDVRVATRVVVTCVGETTALYKGGAASLAMY
jgi:hypothetical protein